MDLEEYIKSRMEQFNEYLDEYWSGLNGDNQDDDDDDLQGEDWDYLEE